MELLTEVQDVLEAVKLWNTEYTRIPPDRDAEISAKIHLSNLFEAYEDSLAPVAKFPVGTFVIDDAGNPYIVRSWNVTPYNKVVYQVSDCFTGNPYVLVEAILGRGTYHRVADDV